jgi:hypothetical protein
MTPAGTPATIDTPGDHAANNSEVMAILLDLEKYGNGVDTINRGHVKNPQRHVFLNAKFTGDTVSPGVGLDGVYRDPWGNPYIITLDLNSDNKARDSFYDTPNVSEDPTSTASPKTGINGLVPTVKNGVSVFEANTTVMVWSAGPDKKVDLNTSNVAGGKANRGANKDNVVSWK